MIGIAAKPGGALIWRVAHSRRARADIASVVEKTLPPGHPEIAGVPGALRHFLKHRQRLFRAGARTPRNWAHRLRLRREDPQLRCR
jgi:hypothetical protein